MCDSHQNDATQAQEAMSRRKFLTTAGLAGAGLASSQFFSNPLVSGLAQAADNTTGPTGKTAFETTAYGFQSAQGKMTPIKVQRAAVGEKDVLLEVLYSGICHSDIHTIHSDWGPTQYPVVPGHEIIGRVTAVGKAVTQFKVGDIGGVGCMVKSCGTCENCLSDREQNCLKGTTFTYGSPDRATGKPTYGGYSKHMVVDEHFVIRIPPSANLAAMAPLLCAGITTFSPLRHWQVKPGQKLGVIGLGGLGHMAVKLGAAHRADVTVFTTTPGKVHDAKRLGAKEAILWSDQQAFQKLRGQFDLLISTVPTAYAMDTFLSLLKLDGTLVNVGALGKLEGLNGMMMGFGRYRLAGSMIGGIAETQEVIDYCSARNIAADIELIKPQDIDRAIGRVMGKDVRYRFVIDMQG